MKKPLQVTSGASLGAHPPERRSTTAPGALTVVFLGVVAGIQMSDRGLHSILSPAIKHAFGVSDAVIGALHGVAGILVASALAVPLARLADRYSRKGVLLGLIALWSVLTALSALSPNFPLFFLGRAASGVTEFAMIPIVYSLIPDLVEDEHRVPANLVFAALMATGASAGFYFGGALLDLAASLSALGLTPWRMALLLLSAAGAPLLVSGLFLPDPPRGVGQEKHSAETAPLLPFLRARWPSILLFLGAAGGLAVAVQATMPMVALALVRRYSADLGVTGHSLGVVTLVTSLASLPVAGLLDRLLQPWLGERSRPAIMAVGALIAVPALVVLGGAPTQGAATLIIAVFLAATCVANALIPTMLQDIAPPALRARGFAVYSFVIAAFCAAGPLLSGLISDHVVHGDLLLAIALAGVPALGLASVCAALGACFGDGARRRAFAVG